MINLSNCIPRTTECSSPKSKHIVIKFLAVKERVRSGQVLIEHISTYFMVVDSLTKGLLPKVFHEHVVLLLDDLPFT